MGVIVHYFILLFLLLLPFNINAVVTSGNTIESARGLNSCFNGTKREVCPDAPFAATGTFTLGAGASSPSADSCGTVDGSAGANGSLVYNTTDWSIRFADEDTDLGIYFPWVNDRPKTKLLVHPNT
jgi:hypothetical protein